MIPHDSITPFDSDGKAWLIGHTSEWSLLDCPCDSCSDHWGEDDDEWDPSCCPDCEGTGRHTFKITAPDFRGGHDLLVSVVPGMVLPIYGQDPGDWPDMLTADRPCVIIKSDGTAVLWDGAGDFVAITLPPAAAPGMWAVQLQQADRQGNA
jgi:hypothetical protein